MATQLMPSKSILDWIFTVPEVHAVRCFVDVPQDVLQRLASSQFDGFRVALEHQLRRRAYIQIPTDAHIRREYYHNDPGEVGSLRVWFVIEYDLEERNQFGEAVKCWSAREEFG